jgi:putative tricarboxylic transport membrane protein
MEEIMTETRSEEPTSSDDSQIKQTGRKRADVVSAIVLILFAAFLIFESSSLPISSEYGPGPGLFPLALGVIIGFLAILLLWDGLNPKVKDKPSKFQNKQGLFAAELVMAGLVGYGVLITRLGYLITTFLLVVFLMKIVTRDKWLTALLTALGVTLLLFMIFTVGLDVHLPRSPFGF